MDLDVQLSRWLFSKVPFKSSLMLLNSHELEDISARMFNSTLVYTKLETTGTWGSVLLCHHSPSLPSSSSSLACPLIWGRQYSCLISFFLHSALFVALSSFNPTSVMSLLHASFHNRFGRPLLHFPGIATSTIFSLYAPLLFSSHGRTASVVFL